MVKFLSAKNFQRLDNLVLIQFHVQLSCPSYDTSDVWTVSRILVALYPSCTAKGSILSENKQVRAGRVKGARKNVDRTTSMMTLSMLLLASTPVSIGQRAAIGKCVCPPLLRTAKKRKILRARCCTLHCHSL